MPQWSRGAQRASSVAQVSAARIAAGSMLGARIPVLIAALLAALLGSAAANLSPSAHAGELSLPGTGLKAVVILGPFGELQTMGRTSADAIADAAEAQGMRVSRIFHPNATWARVVEASQNADLLVYVGHGNGWPSPYAPFQEDTKDGFGLNLPDPDKRGAYQVRYYGANKIRDRIRLADNAVVMFNHLCYASGYGEQWMSPPSESVAVQRVDNFAAGFLAIGARAVFALEYDYVARTVDWLLTSNTSMEGVFRKRWGRDSQTSSYYGFVDWKEKYFDSKRMPGNRMLLDPHPTESYRRAITGDLDFTTQEWRGSAPEPDTTAPELTLSASASGVATVSDAESVTTFSPNGDGIDDAVVLGHRVSEASRLDIVITDAAETPTTLRTMTDWSEGGDGSTSWNGKGEDGTVLPNGLYRVTATARDPAGNTSAPQSVDVRVLSLLRAPAWDARAIHVRDGDALASGASFGAELLVEASVTYRVEDRAGQVVRSWLDPAPEDPPAAAGALRFAWDGMDAGSVPVADGQYWATIRGTIDAGSVAYRRPIWVGPFRLGLSDETPRRGQRIRFTVDTTEPLSAAPRLTIKQPGLTAYYWTLARVTDTRYRATFRLKSGGKRGTLWITVKGVDVNGQSEQYSRSAPLS